MLVNYVFVYSVLTFVPFLVFYLFLRDIGQNCNFPHGINKVFLSYLILSNIGLHVHFMEVPWPKSQYWTMTQKVSDPSLTRTGSWKAPPVHPAASGYLTLVGEC